jgi:error-prone DNA polymerase
LELPAAPALDRLSGWEAMIADYATTGLTTGPHALALLRDRLRGEGMVTSAGLATLCHGSRVTVAGIVVARQRPGTAKGIVFMLLEDEAGTINLVVGPDVYERARTIVRSEPLVVADGRLERHPVGGGQINVVVSRLRALDGAERPAAEVKDFSPLDEAELERRRAAAGGGDFRAVAPPIQSFASGRRR